MTPDEVHPIRPTGLCETAGFPARAGHSPEQVTTTPDQLWVALGRNVPQTVENGSYARLSWLTRTVDLGSSRSIQPKPSGRKEANVEHRSDGSVVSPDLEQLEALDRWAAALLERTAPRPDPAEERRVIARGNHAMRRIAKHGHGEPQSAFTRMCRELVRRLDAGPRPRLRAPRRARERRSSPRRVARAHAPPSGDSGPSDEPPLAGLCLAASGCPRAPPVGVSVRASRPRLRAQGPERVTPAWQARAPGATT